MAVLFMDSGETATTQLRKWDDRSPDAPPAGPLSACGAFDDDFGYSPALDENYGAGGVGSYLQKNLAANEQTLGLGAYVNLRNAGTNWFPIFTIRDGATTQGQIIAFPDGSIGAWRGTAAAGALVDQSVVGLLSIFLWPYVGMKYKVDNAVGEIIIEVDGVEVLSFAGDTQVSANAYATNWWIGGRPPAVLGLTDVGIFISHIWCNNASGTKNNGIPSPRRICCRTMVAAGVQDNYIPSAGASVDCIKEHFPDDDTTTMVSSTTGHKGLFTVDPIVAFPETEIFAVGVSVQDKLGSAGATTARQLLRIGATEHAAATYAPTTSYLDHVALYENDLTLAQLNAVQVGTEVVNGDTDHVVTKVAIEVACLPVREKNLAGGVAGTVIIPSSEIVQVPHWQDDPQWELIIEQAHLGVTTGFQYAGGCTSPGCVAWFNKFEIGSHNIWNQKARLRLGPGDYPVLVPGLMVTVQGVVKWDFFSTALDPNTHPVRIWVVVNGRMLTNVPSGFPPGDANPLPFSLDTTTDVNGELIIDYGVFRDHGVGSLSLNGTLDSLEVILRNLPRSYGYVMKHHS